MNVDPNQGGYRPHSSQGYGGHNQFSPSNYQF
jgi:hypothetical protein